MNPILKETKQTLRAFLRANYSDEQLASLLAHAQSGRLAFYSCCCFIGIPTATHALQGERYDFKQRHYLRAKELPGADAAEQAYVRLCMTGGDSHSDVAGCRRIIPIVKAEIRRRGRERQRTASIEDGAFTEVGESVPVSH